MKQIYETNFGTRWRNRKYITLNAARLDICYIIWIILGKVVEDWYSLVSNELFCIYAHKK